MGIRCFAVVLLAATVVSGCGWRHRHHHHHFYHHRYGSNATVPHEQAEEPSESVAPEVTPPPVTTPPI